MSKGSGKPRAFVQTFSFVVAGEKATFVKYDAYDALKAENERLKATIKHHKEGTIFCPNCGERGIKDEFITNCVCGASWMTAHQAEMHSIYERDHLRKQLGEARDALSSIKNSRANGVSPTAVRRIARETLTKLDAASKGDRWL